MCSTVRCPICQKATWAGCGMHIEQALAGFAANEICRCNDEDSGNESISATATSR